MAPNNELIYKHLEKIRQSSQFNKSKISRDLLDYLVSATLKGENPKEYTIGIDLFGKKYDDAEKQDSKIRVYIHNLRKKLKQYYAEAGKKDSLIFEIEKGKYNVQFISRKEIKSEKPKLYKIPFLISLGLLVILSTFFILNSPKNKSNSKHFPVWNKFADNGKKNLLVLGDYFVFSGLLPTGNFGVYRDFSINSEIDYEHLLDKNPDLINTLSKSPLTYLSKMSVYCQNDIQRVFAKMGMDIEVKLSSDVQPDDLKEYNIIYIGNYKNMGLFENIVKQMSFNYGISANQNQIIFSDDPCAIIYQPDNTDLKTTDYSLVLSTEGYSDNHFVFFLSTQDIGNISTVGLFTEPVFFDKLKAEQKKIINNNEFKALFQVEGINKTDLSYKLIRLE